MSARYRPDLHPGDVCRYRVKRHRPELFGRRCRVLVVGHRLNQIAVEFDDGEQVLTVANSVQVMPADWCETPAAQQALDWTRRQPGGAEGARTDNGRQ